MMCNFGRAERRDAVIILGLAELAPRQMPFQRTRDHCQRFGEHGRLACRGRRPRRPHLYIFSVLVEGGESVGEGADCDIRDGTT
jgi:hypothetical protein